MVVLDGVCGMVVSYFLSFLFALVSIFGFGLLSLANEESLVPAGDSLLLEIFFSSLLKG